MEDLIKMVRTYRFTDPLSDRLRLGEQIFRVVEPDLRMFVFCRITHHAAEDALQEVLKAITIGLKKFEGNTEKEFWKWCYRIARNKLNDHYRDKATDLIQPVPPEDLQEIIDLSTHTMPMTAQTKLDLDYAMNLLNASKPECFDLLWKHYVTGFNYSEIAEAQDVNYDSVRMKIARCLKAAKSLIA